MAPPYRADEIISELGEKWQTNNIRVKQHAMVATVHSSIECVAALQTRYPDRFRSEDADGLADTIRSITVEMSRTSYKHGGDRIARPITTTGAQMSAMYALPCSLLMAK
jgi:aconitate decarboxylase